LFSLIITEYLRLGNLQKKEVYFEALEAGYLHLLTSGAGLMLYDNMVEKRKEGNRVHGEKKNIRHVSHYNNQLL
jgi:hypothetical protein